MWFSERRRRRRFSTSATVESEGRPENPFSVRPSDSTARCATAQRLRLGIADNSAVCRIHGSGGAGIKPTPTKSCGKYRRGGFYTLPIRFSKPPNLTMWLFLQEAQLIQVEIHFGAGVPPTMISLRIRA